MTTLDACDLQILEALQRDASLSHKQLAALCHVSEATCSRRIASLKKRGYITKHTILLDRKKLGLNLAIFVLVAMEKEHAVEIKRFIEKLRKVPWVLSLSFISGEYDYLLHVLVPDMQHYTDFTEHYLTQEHYVKKFLSLFEMKTLKCNGTLPLITYS